MRKIYRKLKKDQIERGVVFASTLSKETIECEGDLVHEVMEDDPMLEEKIRNLKDDSFFNDSPWRYNIIRQ